jgi:hypothetical protein
LDSFAIYVSPFIDTANHNWLFFLLKKIIKI